MEHGNELGTAGFVTSLVGVLTCGILCPIGLVLSIIAVCRRPRGMAVAGIVVGVFGCVLLVAVVLPIAVGFVSVQQFDEQQHLEQMHQVESSVPD